MAKVTKAKAKATKKKAPAKRAGAPVPGLELSPKKIATEKALIKKLAAKKPETAKRFAKTIGRPKAISEQAVADATILDRLWETIVNRREVDPTVSHSARLLSRGTAKIAQKFGEEAVECVIEAVSGTSRSALVAESADVLYHLMVLWVDAEIAPEEIWAELARREGISGIAEKASRLQILRSSQRILTTKIP
jgi:phosphoribosyl-ATP pyrophosphohydrolase